MPPLPISYQYKYSPNHYPISRVSIMIIHIGITLAAPGLINTIMSTHTDTDINKLALLMYIPIIPIYQYKYRY